MLKHLYLMFILTFLVGICSGVFIFFETRGDDVKNEPPNPVSEKGFEILAYRYGGCERLGCTSYRILDDGTYTYIERNSAGNDAKYEDSISSKRLEELTSSLEETDFAALTVSQYSGTCPADYDGISYRYEIRVENTHYSFDSCTEDISPQSFFKLLESYFEVFGVTHQGTV